MTAESLVSQELKALFGELSASQTERRASPAAAPDNVAAPTSGAQEGSVLHGQIRQLADELKDIFDGTNKTVSAHPTQSVVGALLVGILLRRLLGRR